MQPQILVPISPVEDIVADMRAGRMVILVDEEDRENEGDLVLAADHVTSDAINFMARFVRALICLTLTLYLCLFYCNNLIRQHLDNSQFKVSNHDITP